MILTRGRWSKRGIKMEDGQFIEFDNWYHTSSGKWQELGITIEKVYDSPYAHQRHLNIVSEFALAHIALFESNQLYWVDFEALSLLNQPAFFRVNIPFESIESIHKEIYEFENYMQGL